MMDFLQLVNILWSAPLQITIAMFLLWQQLGVSSLAGMAFMVIIMPINGYVAGKMKVLSQRVMKVKDKRVKLMNEILNGIKVFKLYAWETSFKDQVLRYRQQEFENLNKTAYMKGVMIFSYQSSPFFVSIQ